MLPYKFADASFQSVLSISRALPIASITCSASNRSVWVSAFHKRTKAVVALLLTFAAGCVDIVGYLTVYKMFTAHMTGDTVHLAQNVLQAHWQEAAVAASVIAAFVIGSIIGRAIIEIGVRRRVRSIASATLLIEAMFIAAVAVDPRAWISANGILVPLAMLAAAMGMQTATLTRIGSLTVHTTFVTGMLNKLAQLISQALFLTYDLRQGQPAKAQREKVLRQSRFIFSIWLLYLVGAGTGTWMKSVWGARSLLLPTGIALVTMLADQWSPLSIEEEQDQP